MRLSVHATFLWGPNDALTEIEVESREPVSNYGERSSFGEEVGVLPPGRSLPSMLQARGTLRLFQCCRRLVVVRIFVPEHA